MKILLQNIWKAGLDWDDPLPPDIVTDLNNWISEVPYLKNIFMGRKYFEHCDNKKEIAVHIFTDASTKAYGAVAYFRYANISNEVKTLFIMSKRRVALIKTLTLPRLELMSAVIGARIYDYLHKLFSDICQQFYLWTDSQITYFWINNNNSLKPFVQNRVSEIQTLTDPKLWQHCSGSSNPADKLTRGESLKSLVDDNLWKFGPSWLIEDESKWPQENTEINHQHSVDLELRKSVISQHSCLADSVPVKRIMAWSKRFIHNCRSYDKLKVPLTTEELKEAEVILLKEVQNNYYQDEIKTLMKKEDIKNNSSIICLRPYLDEKQILRIWSRLFQSEVDPEAVNPILLPKNSKFSELLITEKHKRLLHRGVNVTLSQIRKSYWIPQARQLVKRIIGRCVIYRKHFAKPANQRTGELPKDRISRVSTFLSGWS
ncbi:uncharacterized protein [Parasteatoda tepidariorum]|uniref:uncharacterized protein n=1 Tax=Parasteatoda tepidariorum TaxID=114398 RepID=UPI0039BD43D5